MPKTAMSDQCSRLFHTCQHTTPSARNGKTVIVPVRKRSSVSLAVGWTSSAVGPVDDAPGAGGSDDARARRCQAGSCHQLSSRGRPSLWGARATLTGVNPRVASRASKAPAPR